MPESLPQKPPKSLIFTACALVAERYGAALKGVKGRDYHTFHTAIHSTLSKSLESSRNQNTKIDILLQVYSDIQMNTTSNQQAIDNFIDWVCAISECVNSSAWRGEDVMGIFFNEFNRYKKKSENGQVFTPEHITDFMYKLIDVHAGDRVLDAACGSGGFLVKAMSNMIQEVGGPETDEAATIRSKRLFGIEFDREIYALACANMLIHKDGKTNLEQLDSRFEEASAWIGTKGITKVLMNPPFENKFGCVDIVENVLNSVPAHTLCAFIMPDKKLEKIGKTQPRRILKHHKLTKIIKLPENIFGPGVTTSIFVFESGVPHGSAEIFACYFEDDGLMTVKNKGRHDVRGRWSDIEQRWLSVVARQSGDDSIQWINPKEHLSYQMPVEPFSISEEDFSKVAVDYRLYKKGIDSRAFSKALVEKFLYAGSITSDDEYVRMSLQIGGGDNE